MRILVDLALINYYPLDRTRDAVVDIVLCVTLHGNIPPVTVICHKRSRYHRAPAGAPPDARDEMTPGAPRTHFHSHEPAT
jgi:hypothetical protein